MLDEVGPRPVETAFRKPNFTAEENKALEDGFKIYGTSWTKIKKHYSLLLANRILKNLSDRWSKVKHKSAATTLGGRQRGSLSPSGRSCALDGRQVRSTLSSKDLKVIFYHDASLVGPTTTNFPSVSRDVDAVKDRVKLLKEGAELRLLHVVGSKIRGIITTSNQLKKISWVRVEEVPEDETTGGTEILIFGYHSKPVKSRHEVDYLFIPFVLNIHEGETLLHIKKKCESKFGVSSEDISKWKFVGVLSTGASHLADSDILHSFWEAGDELRVEHPSF